MTYLTIEQIKQLTKGDYLYIVVLANKASSFYLQIDSINHEFVWGKYGVCRFDEYGKTWVAYKNKEQVEVEHDNTKSDNTYILTHTPQEIKTALKCCIFGETNCADCPYHENNIECLSDLPKDALEYIKKLEKTSPNTLKQFIKGFMSGDMVYLWANNEQGKERCKDTLCALADAVFEMSEVKEMIYIEYKPNDTDTDNTMGITIQKIGGMSPFDKAQIDRTKEIVSLLADRKKLVTDDYTNGYTTGIIDAMKAIFDKFGWELCDQETNKEIDYCRVEIPEIIYPSKDDKKE